MSFYNHRTSISNTTNSISPFYFDKIYTSRKQMDDACAADGVYLGRFVLVKYGVDDCNREDSTDHNGFDVVANAENDGEDIVGAEESLGDTWTHNFWRDAIAYWRIHTKYTEDEPHISANVLGYDNTVWQKNLVNGQMKYIMISSLYSPTIDMTANLLNGELTGGDGIIVTPTSAPSGSNYLWDYKFDADLGQGLKFSTDTDKKIQVNAGNGLTFVSDTDNPDKLQISRADTSLDFVSGGLRVKRKTSGNGGGLVVTTDGLSVNPGSGIKLHSDKVAANLALDGGLEINNDDEIQIKVGNGLAIEKQDISHFGELKVNLEAGEGIYFSPSGNKIIIGNDAPNIDMSNSGFALTPHYSLTYNNGTYTNLENTNWDYDITWYNSWQTYNPNFDEVAYLNWKTDSNTSSLPYPPSNNYRVSRHPNVKVFLNKSGNEVKGGEIQIWSNYFTRAGDLIPINDSNYAKRYFAFVHALASTAWSTDEIGFASDQTPSFSANTKICLLSYEQLSNYIAAHISDTNSTIQKRVKKAQSILLAKWRFERSIICRINFNTDNNKDHSSFDMSTLKLTNISSTATGIWNIGTDNTNVNPRASWQATVRIQQMENDYTGITQGDGNSGYTLTKGAIIIYAVSYADGYNSQFSEYKDLISSQNCLYTGNVNITVNGKLSPIPQNNS